MQSEQTSRRAFIQMGLAGGAAAVSLGASEGQIPPLPEIKLGEHRVSRLILGSNPFNGFSYGIPSLGQHMREWSTPERIAEVLRRCQQNGINTWQFSYYPTSMEALKLHRSAGGRMQWILLTGGDMKENPGLIPEVVKLKPLAIAHHGGVTDERFRAGSMDKVRDYLKAIRDSGVLVGLSTHLPSVIEWVEERNWDIDFYMACMFQIGRPEGETRKMLGDLPLGEVFLEGDPPRMCGAIRHARRPCLAFKVLAAGRRGSSPEQLERALRFTFGNIKPQDAAIVGMYPRFKDEVGENAELVRRICWENP